MKFLIVFALAIVAALAAPADVEITKSNFDNIGIDGYKFEYVQFKDNGFKVIKK